MPAKVVSVSEFQTRFAMEGARSAGGSMSPIFYLTIRGALTKTSLILLVAGIAPFARAQQSTVSLDPARTKITFTLDATFHTVHGSVRLKRGVVRYDLSTGKA